ncbi:MAG: homoserine dehydrogenase [Candidatus Heimdallarchaeota archaeon]
MKDTQLRLAFIGFGTVGQGLAEILVEQGDILKEEFGFDYSVVAISDKIKGAVYDEGGLDLPKLLELVAKHDSITDYPAGIHGWDSLKTITDTNANVIIEVSWTDITTGEPALTHVKTAISCFKHVVMTNKGPVALEARMLLDMAAANGVQLKFEGTVLSGTPAINLGIKNLAGSQITQIAGIVNGTTNFILTEMAKGQSYERALARAQELGYAEADPTADVEGYDALGKIVILSNVVMGGKITKDQVPCQGITHLTVRDIEAASQAGKCWKLIAKAKIHPDGSVEASVRPEQIPLTHPLAAVSGPTNALTYSTKYLGDITIIGPGAGKAPTGYALLTDLLDIHRQLRK